MMKPEKSHWWGIRILWFVLGGMWGGWLGYQPVSHYLPITNHDTAGGLFVVIFGLIEALVGIVLGGYLCVMIGGLTELIMRRLRVGIVAALIVASLLNVLAAWQLTNYLQANYAGFQTVVEKKAKPNKAIYPPSSSKPHSFCSDPRPTGDREGRTWDLECR